MQTQLAVRRNRLTSWCVALPARQSTARFPSRLKRSTPARNWQSSVTHESAAHKTCASQPSCRRVKFCCSQNQGGRSCAAQHKAAPRHTTTYICDALQSYACVGTASNSSAAAHSNLWWSSRKCQVNACSRGTRLRKACNVFPRGWTQCLTHPPTHPHPHPPTPINPQPHTSNHVRKSSDSLLSQYVRFERLSTLWRLHQMVRLVFRRTRTLHFLSC